MTYGFALARSGRHHLRQIQVQSKRFRRVPASGLAALAAGVSLAALAAGAAQPAFAADECGPDSGGVAVCTPASGVGNPYPGGIYYAGDPAEDITVVLQGGAPAQSVHVATSGYGVTVESAYGFDATAVLNAGASVLAYANGVTVTAMGGGDATVDNSASIQAGATAIDVTVQNGGAGASALVSNVADLTVNGDSSVKIGIAAGITAVADGPVIVYSTGDIMVSSHSDGEAYGITANSLQSYGFVQSYGDLTVLNYAGSASGITVAGATDADLLSAGDVLIFGREDAVGLFVESSGGSGNIEAVGDVSVYAGRGMATGVAGESRASDLTLSVNGDIYAGGYTAAAALDAQAGGDVTVFVGGDIDATSWGYAYGIRSDATGDTDIYVTGSILAEASQNAFGVFINQASDGSVDLDVNGGVTAYSRYSAAAGVIVRTGGDIAIDVDGDVLVQAPYNAAYGVGAYSVHGAAYVSLDGDVTVSGTQGAAVYATGQDGAVVISTGSIRAYGTEGVLVHSQSYQAYARVVDVLTTADYAEAVQVSNRYGYAAAVASGDILTFGYQADGLVSYSTYATAYATSTGAVRTYGANSTGIDAGSFTGGAWITNQGAVTTYGQYSTGLYAHSAEGNGTVFGDGSVTTWGSYARGIFATAAYGEVDVLGFADVATYGFGSTGIQASAYLGVDIAMQGGQVETWGDYAPGVNAFASGGEVGVTIGVVETHGEMSTGILAVSQGSNLGDTVEVEAGFVRTSGDNAVGVSAFSQVGDVVLDLGTVLTYGQSAGAVQASSNNGDVVVNFGSVRTYGDAAYLGSTPSLGGISFSYADGSTAVSGHSANGAVYIYGDDVLTTGTDATGIWATGWGLVQIEAASVITLGASTPFYSGPNGTLYGSGAIGIDGRVFGGDINVAAGTVRTSGDYAEGIRTHSTPVVVGGSTFWGDSYIYAQHVYTFGDHSDGIQATSNGGAVRTAGYNVVTYGDWSDAVDVGAWSYETPQGSVVLSSADIETHAARTYGDHARALDIMVDGGDVATDVYFATTTGDYSTAAYLRAFTFYGPSNTTSGDIDATVSYAVTLGDFSTGIDAYSHGGDVHLFTDGIYTGGDASIGVLAVAGGGRVDLSIGDVLTVGQGSDGVVATGLNGEAYVEVGSVRVYGASADAVTAHAYGLNGEVHFASGGKVYAAQGVGLVTVSESYSNIHIHNGSEVRGLGGIVTQTGGGTFLYIDDTGVVTGTSGAAIDANGAAAVIHNDGKINGFIDLTGGADVLINNDTWEARATSAFGAANDTVANYGTVFFRGAGGLGTTTSFTGLEGFTNRALVSGVDSQVNDILTMSGATFTGGKGSQLGLDVQFGGPGSSADRLVIGRATGTTKIVPSSVLSGSPGAINLAGILVVDSAYASQTGAEFTMTAVPAGLVTYSLKFDAPNDNWLIVGQPGKGAGLVIGAIAAPGGTGGLGLNGLGLGGVGGHLAELRGGPMAGQALGFSEADEQVVDVGGLRFWSRSDGETAAQDGLFAAGAPRAMQFGVERRSGDTVWGVSSGYLSRQAEASDGAGRVAVQALDVNAFAAWASDGYFGNVGASGGVRILDARLAGASSLDPVSAMSWGLQGEAGYRFEEEGAWFVEPVVSLAWSSTRAEDLNAGPTRLEFGAGESLTARAGVRMGWTLQSDHMALTPTLGLYAVDALASPDQASLVSGDERALIGDPLRGAWGVAEFGAVLRTDWGVEGFVTGAWNLGGDVDGGGARVGARWRW